MIRPCLTFVDRAEEAVKLYVSVFPNSKIVSMQRVESDGGPIPKGKLLNATFELDGREYLAFDGGPSFTFTEGISLMVMCKTQQEVDNYWTKLTENGGEEGPCGWLKDRFGVSWQIVPIRLTELLQDPDREKSQRVMAAMMEMRKIDVEGLERAAAAA